MTEARLLRDDKSIYRHEARTPLGDFRRDDPRDLRFIVVYAGQQGSPEDSARRLRDREGIVYAWARDEGEAERMVERAREEGKLNVIVSPVQERRQLPPKPKGFHYNNLPHEFISSSGDGRIRDSCDERFDEGPHEP